MNIKKCPAPEDYVPEVGKACVDNIGTIYVRVKLSGNVRERDYGDDQIFLLDVEDQTVTWWGDASECYSLRPINGKMEIEVEG